MSLIKLMCVLFLALSLTSCNEVEVGRYDNLPGEKRDSIAERFNTIANQFWQPTEGYRRYKDSAILIKPEDVGYRQTLSYAYKKRGEHIQAMETLNKALEMDVAKGSHAALEYRAWSLLYYYRDYEGAIRDIDLITKMSGTTFNVCWGEDCTFQRGQALFRLGRVDEAIEAFNFSLKDLEANGLEVDDEIYTYFYLGRCYQEKGLWEKAIKSYDKALLSHANFSECIFQKARIYRQTGDFNQAKGMLDKAEEMLSDNYKMGEPYFERFDELFPWMIKAERDLQKTIAL